MCSFLSDQRILVLSCMWLNTTPQYNSNQIVMQAAQLVEIQNLQVGDIDEMRSEEVVCCVDGVIRLAS